MQLFDNIAIAAGISIVQLVIALCYLFPLKKLGYTKSYYRLRAFIILLLINCLGVFLYGLKTWRVMITPANVFFLVLGIVCVAILYPLNCARKKGEKSEENTAPSACEPLSSVEETSAGQGHWIGRNSRYIQNIIRNIWPIIFMISVLAMVYYPPYHQVKANIGDSFVGYGTFTEPPSYKYKGASIDMVRLGLQIIVSVAVCTIGYKITKK